MKAIVAVALFGLIVVAAYAQEQDEHVENAPKVHCPEQFEHSENILLPNPSDCNSFYQCVWGVPYLMECPSNLHFNPEINMCDWPEDANSIVAVALFGLIVVAAYAQEQDEHVENAPKVHCPEQFEHSENILLPNPSDCNSFYQCVWGVPYLMECPSNLHFNPEINMCDWPEDANCKLVD
ncbi:peritrophin-1-like [Copidosoma floridanum]|uniref:peritrophin-1-like n=1 Tax=Copidosoma floridanum TaxID=29053 RepID=UPI0006C9C3F2|nr:peritrophin-1-like [Copidosoma floridanum]